MEGPGKERQRYLMGIYLVEVNAVWGSRSLPGSPIKKNQKKEFEKYIMPKWV